MWPADSQSLIVATQVRRPQGFVVSTVFGPHAVSLLPQGILKTIGHVAAHDTFHTAVLVPFHDGVDIVRLTAGAAPAPALAEHDAARVVITGIDTGAMADGA